jgi:hypothetical protein
LRKKTKKASSKKKTMKKNGKNSLIEMKTMAQPKEISSKKQQDSKIKRWMLERLKYKVKP